MMENLSRIKKINKFLVSYTNKKLLIAYFFISLFSGLTEVASIGFLFPLVDLLVETDKYLNNSKVYFFLNFFDVDKNNYVIFFILIFATTITLSYIAKIILVICRCKLENDFGYKLNIKIFSKTIHKDYDYHTKSNSSRFLGNMEKVEGTRSFGTSILESLKALILIFMIIPFLMIIEPKLVSVIFVILIILFLILSLLFKPMVSQYGIQIANLVNTRYLNLQESTYNIKDTIIRNAYNSFISKFGKIVFKIKNINIRAEIVAVVPQQGILLIASLVLISVIYFSSETEEGIKYYFSFIAAMTLTIQRLMPNFQSVYASWINIKMQYPSLLDISDLIDSKESESEFIQRNISYPIEFNDKIVLKDINFAFESKKIIFENANIELKKGKSYGIKGISGVGKSTLIDLITGLLKPDSGKILIDKNKLNTSSIFYWQKKISLVSQEPVILDDTVNNNIIFNETEVLNKLEKVTLVSKKSESFNFIESMEKKFETVLGEKGIRISGGQRQRISVARALFREFEVLILDEATNAVNVEIEKKMYDNIINDHKDKLILVISHRVSVYDKLDHIIEIKDKKIKILS